MAIIDFLEKGPGFIILLIVLLFLFFVIFFFVHRSSRRAYTGRIMIPVFFIELALLFGIMALGFPKKGDAVGAGIVPLIWIIGILGLSIFLLIRGIWRHEDEDPPWGRVSSVGIMIALILLYLLFMQFIGYSLSTLIFLVSAMMYLSYRNWKVMIAISAGWILFSYIAFYKLLYVPLPRGILIEWIF